MLHAFSAFTGAWVSRPLGANVAASVRRSGDPAVAVIPEGPYVVPYHAPESAAA